ncbi:protein kinase domain protein [Ichthyophthirius multifiliis]|uniref:Protein kinase domain protein n=1 Tax=Ichthyophthirius multifiliis TaxID=5932 RepID=G0R039_ICHMU|nr:protein kinase domain protein [Ichthyophthirius multifiliis]EGR29165.1 protein kinase domain protein [Ichthyophthirius multifiliis]|eukprot:XP_004030401.1 protein kinase domain protein [Ichthyophthirius multifiliis]
MNMITVSDSQFYICSLLLCINYLHTNNTILRYKKPENIMVDFKDKLMNRQLKVPQVLSKRQIYLGQKQEKLERLVKDKLKNENQQKQIKDKAKDHNNWDKYL